MGFYEESSGGNSFYFFFGNDFRALRSVVVGRVFHPQSTLLAADNFSELGAVFYQNFKYEN